MRAYSTDLRETLVLAYENGEGTLDEIADTFGVGRCTVARMLKLYREGEGLAPKPHRGGYPASLSEKMLGLLRQQVESQPDATLLELAAYLNKRAKVQVHVSTLCRALQKLGLPRKKKPCRCRTRRSRPRDFSRKGRAVGSPSLRLHRRNRLPFGNDSSVRTRPTWTAGGAARAPKSRHGGLADWL